MMDKGMILIEYVEKSKVCIAFEPLCSSKWLFSTSASSMFHIGMKQNQKLAYIYYKSLSQRLSLCSSLNRPNYHVYQQPNINQAYHLHFNPPKRNKNSKTNMKLTILLSLFFLVTITAAIPISLDTTGASVYSDSTASPSIRDMTKRAPLSAGADVGIAFAAMFRVVMLGIVGVIFLKGIWSI